MKPKICICVNCNAEMKLVETYTQLSCNAGGAIGATLGLFGFFGKRTYRGSLINTVTGFAAGALVGHEFGHYIDQHVNPSYHCPNCDGDLGQELS